MKKRLIALLLGAAILYVLIAVLCILALLPGTKHLFAPPETTPATQATTTQSTTTQATTTQATTTQVVTTAPPETTVPPTTVPPTTVPPTTVPPTTVPPTTVPPTTVPPTTVPPTTVPPTTVPPTTVPPTTVPPTTVPPTTVPPTTVPPTTVPPTTVPPTTVPPTTVPETTGPSVALPTAPTPAAELDARNAFVYFCDEDRLACLKGQLDTPIHPASITKLFSIYTALQYLDPAQQVTVGTIIYNVPMDASFAYVKEGDVLTVEDLVAAMLLPSGNDAAMVMAVEAGRAISSDSAMEEAAAMELFIQEINRQVTVLGLINTHFSCADGYGSTDHYTCMADLITIAKLCLENPTIRRIAAMPEYHLELANGRTLSWKNTNWLLHQEKSVYNAYAIGLKTGFTNAAGNCLISAFHVNGQDIIIGVFGCSSIPDRFADTQALFEEFA